MRFALTASLAVLVLAVPSSATFSGEAYAFATCTTDADASIYTMQLKGNAHVKGDLLDLGNYEASVALADESTDVSHRAADVGSYAINKHEAAASKAVPYFLYVPPGTSGTAQAHATAGATNPLADRLQAAFHAAATITCKGDRRIEESDSDYYGGTSDCPVGATPISYSVDGNLFWSASGVLHNNKMHHVVFSGLVNDQPSLIAFSGPFQAACDGLDGVAIALLPPDAISSRHVIVRSTLNQIAEGGDAITISVINAEHVLA